MNGSVVLGRNDRSVKGRYWQEGRRRWCGNQIEFGVPATEVYSLGSTDVVERDEAR